MYTLTSPTAAIFSSSVLTRTRRLVKVRPVRSRRNLAGRVSSSIRRQGSTLRRGASKAISPIRDHMAHLDKSPPGLLFKVDVIPPGVSVEELVSALRAAVRSLEGSPASSSGDSLLDMPIPPPASPPPDSPVEAGDMLDDEERLVGSVRPASLPFQNITCAPSANLLSPGLPGMSQKSEVARPVLTLETAFATFPPSAGSPHTLQRHNAVKKLRRKPSDDLFELSGGIPWIVPEPETDLEPRSSVESGALIPDLDDPVSAPTEDPSAKPYAVDLYASSLDELIPRSLSVQLGPVLRPTRSWPKDKGQDPDAGKYPLDRARYPAGMVFVDKSAYPQFPKSQTPWTKEKVSKALGPAAAVSRKPLPKVSPLKPATQAEPTKPTPQVSLTWPPPMLATPELAPPKLEPAKPTSLARKQASQDLRLAQTGPGELAADWLARQARRDARVTPATTEARVLQNSPIPQPLRPAVPAPTKALPPIPSALSRPMRASTEIPPSLHIRKKLARKPVPSRSRQNSEPWGTYAADHHPAAESPYTAYKKDCTAWPAIPPLRPARNSHAFDELTKELDEVMEQFASDVLAESFSPSSPPPPPPAASTSSSSSSSSSRVEQWVATQEEPIIPLRGSSRAPAKAESKATKAKACKAESKAPSGLKEKLSTATASALIDAAAARPSRSPIEYDDMYSWYHNR